MERSEGAGARTGGALIADVLSAQGVRALYTLCGGHISPILVESKRRGIRVVDVRHEATAVFAADATARLTGGTGVAAVTAGPGVTNTLTALQNARLAHSPLVLLGGATATVLRGRGALQDIDQLALLAPVVKWQTSVSTVRGLAPALEEAFRRAQEGVPGPVFVECPVDLLYDEALVRSWYTQKSSSASRSLLETATAWYLRRHLDGIFDGAGEARVAARLEVSPPSPEPGSVGTAAFLLARAERPVLVVGSQALGDAQQAPALARAVRTLGLPTYLSGMARGLLGTDSPLQRRHRRKEALREADLVLLAGTPCDFRLDYGRHVGRGATLVAVNRDRQLLTLNRRPTLGVNADAGLFLRLLAEEAPTGFPRPEWLATLAERDAARDTGIDVEASAGAAREARGIDPVAACRAIEEALPPRAVLVADGGDFVATASYVVRQRGPLAWLDPGVFGTLGVGAGFAIAAAVCRPGEPVVLLWGDGSAGYGLAEVDTFVRHGLGIAAVVGNDACWTQIAREQVEILGDDVGTPLLPSAYHEAAAGLGAEGLVARRAAELPAVLGKALAAARAGRPALVNLHLGKTAFRKGSISM